MKKSIIGVLFAMAIMILGGFHAETVQAANPAFKMDSYTIALGDGVYVPYLVNSSAGLEFYTEEDLSDTSSTPPATWGSSDASYFGYDTLIGSSVGSTTVYAVDAEGNYDTMVLNVTATPAFVPNETTTIGFQAGQLTRAFLFSPSETNTYHFSITGTTYSEILILNLMTQELIGLTPGNGYNTSMSARLEAGNMYYIGFYVYDNSAYELSAPNAPQTLNVTVTKNAKATGVSLHANAYALKIDGDTYYMMEGDEFDLKVVFEGGANVEKEDFDIGTTNSTIASVDSINKTEGTAKIHCNVAGTVDVSIATTNMHTDSFKLVVLSQDQVIAGDVDLDGTITKSDIQNIYAVINGLSEKTRVYFHADVNGDGNLNDEDIKALWDVVGGLPYIDVADSDWFYDAVAYNYNEGIMTGMNSIQFGPYESLSRAQFALILYRMQGTPEVTVENPFDDIVGDEWYADAVLWAYDNGIVTGFGDNTFRPADLITREQMVVMMYRYANYLEEDTSVKADYDEFIDADSVSEYAEEAMQWAVGNGILTGKVSEEGSMLAPWGATARAEAAAIIQRFASK